MAFISQGGPKGQNTTLDEKNINKIENITFHKTYYQNRKQQRVTKPQSFHKTQENTHTKKQQRQNGKHNDISENMSSLEKTNEQSRKKTTF